jgi:ABC-type Mn2+/Zn2+ transport system ATPase subunit
MQSGSRQASLPVSTGPRLSIEHLSVAYGAHVAVEDLTLQLGPGCIASVVGPNGAGKSTLFNAILGLTPSRRGQIVCAGRPAYVPQGDHARLDLPITALDVALMGRLGAGRFWRRLRREDHKLAAEALDRVGMADHARCQVAELSGGQRQRVMLARALTQGGSLYLLDEPFTGVDGTSSDTILSVLQTLRDGGTTILMSTHDLNQAASISDRLLFLNRRLIADGPPGEVFKPSVLQATYGGDLFVKSPGGQPLGVLDDASHHHHGTHVSAPPHPDHHHP